MNDYGYLTVTKQRDEHGGESFTAEWIGRPIILITHELMDDHLDPPFHRDGDNLTICQYKLRIIARTERGDYVAERVA